MCSCTCAHGALCPSCVISVSVCVCFPLCQCGVCLRPPLLTRRCFVAMCECDAMTTHVSAMPRSVSDVDGHHDQTHDIGGPMPLSRQARHRQGMRLVAACALAALLIADTVRYSVPAWPLRSLTTLTTPAYRLELDGTQAGPDLAAHRIPLHVQRVLTHGFKLPRRQRVTNTMPCLARVLQRG